jgi:hypothetical protein
MNLSILISRVSRADVILLSGLLLLMSACRARTSSDGGSQSKDQAIVTVHTEIYKPIYGARDSGVREKRGTVRGDFQWAADAPTLGLAASRWEEFLRIHNPPGQEFEDSLHASYVTAAQYELMRVYYLLGRSEDGDALLRRLDPVGWMK